MHHLWTFIARIPAATGPVSKMPAMAHVVAGNQRPRSRWIVAPRVRQTTDGNSQCDVSHAFESSEDITTSTIHPHQSWLYHDSLAGNAVWWEIVPGKSHSFGIVGHDFNIIGHHRSNQGNSDTGSNADDFGFYMPPTALYLYSSKSGWTLLGGRDAWTQLTSVEASEALSDGYMPTGEAIDQWPLPRSRSQTFTIEGSDGGGHSGVLQVRGCLVVVFRWSIPSSIMEGVRKTDC